MRPRELPASNKQQAEAVLIPPLSMPTPSWTQMAPAPPAVVYVTLEVKYEGGVCKILRYKGVLLLSFPTVRHRRSQSTFGERASEAAFSFATCLAFCVCVPEPVSRSYMNGLALE